MTQSFPPDQSYLQQLQPCATWRLRLLLAATLLFGSEVLLWTDPPGRAIADWIPLSIGYLAVASLLLDLAARFRLRNVFGLLALAGIYGLLNGLLLNPDTALIDLPRTLFTRVIGAHAFLGLLMLALFLRLVTPAKLTMLMSLVAGALVGFGWGTWARWSPTLLRPDATDTPLLNLLVVAALVAVIMGGLLLWKQNKTLSDLRLNPLEWLIVLVVLIGLLVVRGLNNQIDVLWLIVIGMLAAFCLVLLWFLKREKGRTLLDGIGLVTPPWGMLLAMAAGFIGLALVSYGLPRGEGAQDPVFILTALFTAFGLTWLPGMSLVIGAQALSRQIRAGKL